MRLEQVGKGEGLPTPNFTEVWDVSTLMVHAARAAVDVRFNFHRRHMVSVVRDKYGALERSRVRHA